MDTVYSRFRSSGTGLTCFCLGKIPERAGDDFFLLKPGWLFCQAETPSQISRSATV